MSVYERTPADEFLYSQQNVGNIMMIANQNYVRYDVVPERLSVTLFGGVYRFFNVSSLYRHYLTSYNYGGNVEAYLGRWTLRDMPIMVGNLSKESMRDAMVLHLFWG